MASPKMSHAAKSRGTLFGQSARLYDRIRPGYPPAAIAAIVESASSSIAGAPAASAVCSPSGGVEEGRLRVLDVGSGTGIFGRALAEAGLDVQAVDPDSALLEVNPLPSRVGRAEALPFADGAFDIVAAAQAWHWFDEQIAAAEFARVLRPGGVAAVVINQLDVRIDWVLRLSRIMHAGDVYRPQWRPGLGEEFSPVEAHIEEFMVPVTIDDVVALTATRTYWLRSSDSVRQRVEANLRWFLTEEHPMKEPFDLPYMCLTHTARKISG